MFTKAESALNFLGLQMIKVFRGDSSWFRKQKNKTEKKEMRRSSKTFHFAQYEI